MDLQKAKSAASAGNAVADLINHYGWTDVLKPLLTKEKAKFAELLVGATLGNNVTFDGVTPVSAAQIAGIIYGINSVVARIETLLRDGARANTELNKLFLTDYSTPVAT